MSSSKPWRKSRSVHKEQKRRKSFCIFTEGETEKIYFKDFGIAAVTVRCLGGGGVLHLVSETVAYMRQPKYSGYDYYWLVFDKDDNSGDDIQQAISIAEKNKIRWCFSNPCFEIWFLLHFDFFQSATTSKELKTRLIPSRIPGYEETMPGVFDILKSRQDFAVGNSLRLWPVAERANGARQLHDMLPATNADSLVCKLNTCNK